MLLRGRAQAQLVLNENYGLFLPECGVLVLRSYCTITISLCVLLLDHKVAHLLHLGHEAGFAVIEVIEE